MSTSWRFAYGKLNLEMLKKEHRLKIRSLREATASDDTADPAERIVIPKRIDRSPIDMLKVLSATVGRDPTMPHYKFHDDPFLIPESMYQRVQYAMAEESGRKAAKWIFNEHGALFNAKDAQPPIQAYIPKPKLDDNSVVQVHDLQEAIDRLEVVRSMKVYELLVAAGVEVPADVKQSLLELVSYHNHADPLPLMHFEERSKAELDARSSNWRDNKTKAIAAGWDSGSLAEQLFQSIQPTTPAAYNTMIRALAKHGDPMRAKKLFDQAAGERVPLDSATYDAYFRCVREETLPLQRRWTELVDTLKRMQEHGVRPTAHTLHAIVAMLTGGNTMQIRSHVESVLAEFNGIGIRPMLGTYSLLFDLYAAMPTQMNAIEAILAEVEAMAELQPHSTDDMQFFTKAMETLRFRVKDSLDYVYRLDRVARAPQNIQLMGDHNMQQLYYRHLLCAILRQETWPKFFDVYNEIVPVIYALEPSVADEILSKINVTGCIEHIPRLCDDMSTSEISKRTSLTESLLRLMLFNRPSDEVDEHKGLAEQFGRIATRIYGDMMDSLDMAEKYSRDVTMNAASLSSILTLQLRAGDFTAARDCFTKCMQLDTQQKLFNPLGETAVTEFLDACIARDFPRTAIRCIQYGAKHNMMAINRPAAKLLKSGVLDAADVRLVKSLIGEEALVAYDNENE